MNYILPRNHQAIRFFLDNGCTLTPTTHDIVDSIHGTPIASYPILKVSGPLVDNLSSSAFSRLLTTNNIRLKPYYY